MLLYLAPAATFAIGVALYFVQVQVSRFFERRLVNNARKTLEQQLANSHTSARHKADIRKMLEELEKSVASAEVARVKLIGLPPRDQA